MYTRFFVVSILALMLSASVADRTVVPESPPSKYGIFVLDKADVYLQKKIPEPMYNVFSEVVSVIAKPEDAINNARTTLIGDNNSKGAQIMNTAIDKILLLTLVVGTGFGLVIRIFMWVAMGG